MCVIDNLVKGAAGGAVQWMNRMLGSRRDDGSDGAGAGLDLNGADMSKSATPAIVKPVPANSRADHLAPVYAQFPIDVVGASGVHLLTREGRRVLDLYGGHAVAALGYGHPRWLAALDIQAQALLFQSNAVPLDVRARAAARLVRFADLPLDTVFFCNTGAEANENALKLALRITGRRKVVAVEGSFHGRTAAAGAVTWGAAREVVRLPAGAVRRRLPPTRRHRGDRTDASVRTSPR